MTFTEERRVRYDTANCPFCGRKVPSAAARKAKAGATLTCRCGTKFCTTEGVVSGEIMEQPVVESSKRPRAGGPTHVADGALKTHIKKIKWLLEDEPFLRNAVDFEFYRRMSQMFWGVDTSKVTVDGLFNLIRQKLAPDYETVRRTRADVQAKARNEVDKRYQNSHGRGATLDELASSGHPHLPTDVEVLRHRLRNEKTVRDTYSGDTSALVIGGVA